MATIKCKMCGDSIKMKDSNRSVFLSNVVQLKQY